MNEQDAQAVSVVFPDGHEETRELLTRGWYIMDLRTGIRIPLGKAITDAKQRDMENANATS